MQVTSAKYTFPNNIAIGAQIDGIYMSVPIDMNNKYYRAIIESGIEIEPYIDPTPTTPNFVSNYQGRAALINQGLFDTVNNYIQNLGTSSLEYQAWEYATNFYRDSPFITSISSALGLTSDQVDQLFIAASNIN